MFTYIEKNLTVISVLPYVLYSCGLTEIMSLVKENHIVHSLSDSSTFLNVAL